MTKRELMMESINDMDTAMESIQRTAQRIGFFAWQDKTIYLMCKAIKLLMELEAKAERNVK